MVHYYMNRVRPSITREIVGQPDRQAPLTPKAYDMVARALVNQTQAEVQSLLSIFYSHWEE